MKLKLLSTFLILQILFGGVQAFAVEPKAMPQNTGSSITKLTEKELESCKFSGVNKKDWAQRLQWFEGKIINKYKSFNAKNVLVIGEQKFLDVFKKAAEKQNWQANFTYATSASEIKINNNGGGGFSSRCTIRSTAF